MPREAVMSIEGLTVRFDGVAAVDGVDFTLQRDELHCLIGPNGAGKSTLFKAVTGVVRPSAGKIWINGHDTTRLQPHAVARLGVSVKTQVPSLLEGLSVRENIWVVARRSNSAKRATQIVDRLMERIGIADDESRVVETMAHGRRQLVEFATALAANPSILLLDEPAAGLSEEELVGFASLLQQPTHSMAVLVVEHNMKFVRLIAERLTVLHKGRILANGEPEQVFNDERVQDVYLGKEAVQ